MPKKITTVGGVTIAIDDWNIQIGKYVCIYLVNKALKNDKEAEDILEALNVVLHDDGGAQIWPPVGPSPMGSPKG